jgi:metallophosphoesterase (TIGR03768 family)
MDLLRRDFLKCCIVSAAALGLEISPAGKLREALAAGVPRIPTYPISDTVVTTLEQTVEPLVPPSLPPNYTLHPSDLQDYATYQYGEFEPDGGIDFLLPDMNNPPNIVPSERDPNAVTLLTFFTISDVHIADKESPARTMYFGYQYPDPEIPNPRTGQMVPAGSSAMYSGTTLYTPHVLDAAVQTINALHKVTPFDFGMALGDACDNNQLNELRWYLDVLDGKMIHPSSGAHLGAGSIDYQKPFQAAGLDKSIKWYQAVGNHDQFWMGAALPTQYTRKTLVGSNILNIGMKGLLPPAYVNSDWTSALNKRGYYMGVVDGSTQYGTVIGAGPTGQTSPITVAADPSRRSLTINQWMGQFFDTTSQPVGHGFTQKMVLEGFACYHFYPKAGIPLKVIVLDDTDKSGSPDGALDDKRYRWLIKELEDGQAADQLMIICAHIPLHAFSMGPPPQNNEPYEYLPIWITNSSVGENVEELDLRAKLHEYPNLVAWISGHVHRNAITPQPAIINGNQIDLEKSFWTIETPSLRDFPQQFRHFEIVRNSDNTISIFVLDVDPADNPEPMPGGSAQPAMTSRHYAIGAQQIFQPGGNEGPGIDAVTGVYNAQLVKQLTQKMQTIVASIKPTVSSFRIAGTVSARKRTVTLNNTVVGSTPTHYIASEFSDFSGAAWQPYSSAPTFTVSSGSGRKIFFKVKDGAGTQSQVVSARIAGK